MNHWIQYLSGAIVVVAGCTWMVFNSYFKMKKRVDSVSSPEVTAAMTRNAETNEQLHTTLKAIESRLESIERTLNEVG